MDHSGNSSNESENSAAFFGIDSDALAIMCVLANPIRIGILTSLGESAKTVREISHELGRPQSTVSHALAALHYWGMVRYTSRKHFHYYELTSEITVAREPSRLAMTISTPKIALTIKVPIQAVQNHTDRA